MLCVKSPGLPGNIYMQANKRIFERWMRNEAFEIASSAVGNNVVSNASA